MGFWIALQFLTIIPIPFKKQWEAKDIASSLVFFPVVGLIIGLLLFLVDWGLGEVFSTVITAVLTLLFWVIISGAMHLDGLADSCDGLGGCTPEKRLEIMKSSHSGAFGVAGVCLLLLIKFAALVSLSGWDRERWYCAVAAGDGLAISVFPYAQRGTGIGFQAGFDLLRWLIASVITLAAAILLAGWWGIAVMAITGLVTLLIGLFQVTAGIDG